MTKREASDQWNTRTKRSQTLTVAGGLAPPASIVLSAFVIAHASKAGRRFRRWWDRRTVRRERIEKIERDIAAFKSEVADVVDCIAPQLADTERERAVLELERLLKEATRAQELAAAIDVKLSTEQQKAEECEQARRCEVIEHLQRTAAVSSVDDLRNAIRRSDEIRSLRGDHQAVAHALAQEGDGMSLAELAEECAATDLDQITAREQTVTQELSDLRDRLMEARETRSAARRDFDAIGGDDTRAKAKAEEDKRASSKAEGKAHTIEATILPFRANPKTTISLEDFQIEGEDDDRVASSA